MLATSSILDWLLGLRRLSWSDPRAALGWRWPLPLWAWVLITLAAAAIGLWSYRRLLGPRPVKIGLGVLRALLVLAVAALLVGPMLVVNQELVEPDALLVLVDQSASMDVRDMPPGSPAPGTESVSRREALEAAIKQHAALFSDQKLGRDRRIVWLGFAGNTYEINPFDPGSQPPPVQERQSTALRTAIEQALQRGAGRPLSGIVVMSDGRSPETVGPGLVHRLQQQAVNVFAVPLGAKTPMLDLGLAEVEAPEKAFVNDAVPVTAWLDHYPDNTKIDPARLRIRLVDTQTGRVLDERHPDDDALRKPVRLSGTSAAVGPVPWRVEMIYDAPAGNATQQVLLTRKQEGVSVELVDQPLGVLYVEGYPRWEFRYLKNMLVREKSIKSSVFLLSADRNFAQEGQIPITRLPTTPEELKPYDVIIIGDVPPSSFSVDQLKLMADHVANRGAGLLWIGGERDTPRGYEGTPLGGLLPMRSPGMVTRLDPSLGAIQIKPTPLAEAIQVLRLRSPDAPADSAEPAWPANLTPLLWGQNLGELKESAEVLATASPAFTSGESGDSGGSGAGTARLAGWPMIVRMRYGAGDVLYVGTDETWRWRYGRGDAYFERMWMELVRLLGRARLQQGNGRAVLEVSNHRLEAGQAAVVSLHINDELLSQRDLSKITVAVSRADAATDKAAALEKIELLPAPGTPGTSGDGKPTGTPFDYQTIWRPTTPGRLLLRVVEPGLEDLNATRSVEVVSADDETRHPVPDHEKLAELAEQTGGKVLALDKLDDLATLVPNRARRTPNDIREPLWNSYLALIAVVTLLTAEWIGRKAIRLV